MSAAAKYKAAADAGMTVMEAARHLRVSGAAVTKAARAYGITFIRRAPKAPTGVQHPSQPAQPYPLRAMAIGDWCRTYCDALSVARQANKRLHPKAFKGHRAGWMERVK